MNTEPVMVAALLELADSVLRLEDGQLPIPAAPNARPS
jgi:hypothetical protein